MMGLKLHADKPKPDATRDKLEHTKLKTCDDMGGEDESVIPGIRLDPKD